MILDIHKRKTFFKKLRSHKEYACITPKTQKLNKNIKILGKIGTESRIASVYNACFPLNCKYKIAVKKIPLSKDDKKYIKNNTTESTLALNKSFLWRELFMLKLCNLLVNKNICPHLPLIYYYNICNNCTFDNPELLKEYKNLKSCILVVNELADGDLKNLLVDIKPSINELEIIYFQIFIAIYCINKYFGIEHQDLHWGNVLYHKVPKGGYIKYIIQGREFLIPNIGYLIVLWDFEFSRIPGKIQPKEIYISKHKKKEDYLRVSSMLLEDDEQKSLEYDNLGVALDHIIKTNSTTNDFVFNYSIYIHNKYSNYNIKNSDIISTYNTDIALKSTDSNIKKFIVK